MPLLTAWCATASYEQCTRLGVAVTPHTDLQGLYLTWHANNAASDLLTDSGVPIVLLCSPPQHHSINVWYDIVLGVTVVIVFHPRRLYPHDLPPANSNVTPKRDDQRLSQT